MYVMNEISLEFSDRIEKILSWKHWSIGSIEEDFDEMKLYTTLFSDIDSDMIHIPETSLFNIFVRLGVKPKNTAEEILTKFKFEDNSQPTMYRRMDDSEEFLDQAIGHMIEFMNLSTYIYLRLGHMKQKKQQKDMLKFLIVAAATMYDELYSSKGKIAFAYYFKKALQNSDNLTSKITPFNSKSWKSEFAKYTKETKENISFLLAGSDVAKPIFIANIALVCGRMTDQNLLPLEERYFIESGIADLQKQDYNRIFITTFL